MTHPRQRGFTLLEAIVALAIIGISLIPLLGFISQSAQQLQAVGDANARNLAKQNVLAFFETLNPMETPEGRVELGDIEVSWSSKMAVAPVTRATPGAGLPNFSVGFYQVNAQVSKNGALWFDFGLRKVGYNRNQQFNPFAQ